MNRILILFAWLAVLAGLFRVAQSYHALADLADITAQRLDRYYESQACGRYLAGLKNLDAAEPFLLTLGVPRAESSAAIEAARQEWEADYPRLQELCADAARLVFYRENTAASRGFPNWSFRVLGERS